MSVAFQLENTPSRPSWMGLFIQPSDSQWAYASHPSPPKASGPDVPDRLAIGFGQSAHLRKLQGLFHGCGSDFIVRHW
jgi:hypothetical protein